MIEFLPLSLSPSSRYDHRVCLAGLMEAHDYARSLFIVHKTPGHLAF
jgi:hypothetical protein